MVYLYAFMAFGLIALILAAIYRPLGDYMYRVYTTDKDLFFEKWIYRIIGVDPRRDSPGRRISAECLASP